jgi:hypothetical protein
MQHRSDHWTYRVACLTLGPVRACAAPDVDENTDSANIVGATEQALTDTWQWIGPDGSPATQTSHRRPA